MKKIHLKAWLFKKCKDAKPFTKKYRPRWFELLQGQLSYCHTPEKSEKGSIHVFAIHELLDVRRCKDRTKMELYFPERILSIRASDEGTLLEWYYAILNSYEHFTDNVQESIKNDTMLSRVAALHTEDAEPDLNLNVNLNDSEFDSDDLEITRAYQSHLNQQGRRHSPRSLLANPKKFLSMFQTRQKSSLRNSTSPSAEFLYYKSDQSEAVLEKDQSEAVLEKDEEQGVDQKYSEDLRSEQQDQKQVDQHVGKKASSSSGREQIDNDKNECLRITEDDG